MEILGFFFQAKQVAYPWSTVIPTTFLKTCLASHRRATLPQLPDTATAETERIKVKVYQAGDEKCLTYRRLAANFASGHFLSESLQHIPRTHDMSTVAPPHADPARAFPIYAHVHTTSTLLVGTKGY